MLFIEGQVAQGKYNASATIGGLQVCGPLVADKKSTCAERCFLSPVSAPGRGGPTVTPSKEIRAEQSCFSARTSQCLWRDREGERERERGPPWWSQLLDLRCHQYLLLIVFRDGEQSPSTSCAEIHIHQIFSRNPLSRSKYPPVYPPHSPWMKWWIL